MCCVKDSFWPYTKQKMAPLNLPALMPLLLILAENEAKQSLKLMTRPSDGAPLCAVDTPTKSAEMSQRIPGAPAAVRCGMTCTADGGCKHFNYVSTESKPCQLYHYRPTDFQVVPNCQHFYEPEIEWCPTPAYSKHTNGSHTGCYQLVTTETTWSEAFYLCLEQPYENSHLLAIQSADEQAAIAAMLEPFTASGGHILTAGQKTGYGSSVFFWPLNLQTIEPVTNYWWYNGEPNVAGEMCLAISPASGSALWVDTSCDQPYRYICEIDPPASIP